MFFLDNFSECHQKCEGFLQSMLFREHIAKDDLYTLTGTYNTFIHSYRYIQYFYTLLQVHTILLYIHFVLVLVIVSFKYSNIPPFCSCSCYSLLIPPFCSRSCNSLLSGSKLTTILFLFLL